MTRAQFDKLVQAEWTVLQARIYRDRVVAQARAQGVTAEQVRAVREAADQALEERRES